MSDPATPNVNSADRRRDPRHAPDDAVSALGRVMDVSVSGMRIRCGQAPPINPGQPFKVELRAEQRVSLLPVRLVEAYRLDEDEQEDGIDIGVEFRRLTPAQHREVEAVIEHSCEIPPLEVGWTTDPEAAREDDEYEECAPVGETAEDALRQLAEDVTSQTVMIDETVRDTESSPTDAARDWRDAVAPEGEPRETQPGEINQRRAGRLSADDAESSLGKVMDISASGLRVRRKGAAPVRVGSVFMMDIQAAGRVLRAPVEVVRIQKIGWRTFDYGLKFGDLPDEVRAEFGRLAHMASKCVEIF